jgi:hypothetical protein
MNKLQTIVNLLQLTHMRKHSRALKLTRAQACAEAHARGKARARTNAGARPLSPTLKWKKRSEKKGKHFCYIRL